MKTHKKSHILLLTGLLVADGLFLSLTSPTRVASFWLIVGFGFVLWTLYEGLKVVLWALSSYFPAVESYKRRVARLITSCCGLLLALQSAGQLSGRDITVLFCLALLGYLYMYYLQRGQRAV